LQKLKLPRQRRQRRHLLQRLLQHPTLQKLLMKMHQQLMLL